MALITLNLQVDIDLRTDVHLTWHPDFGPGLVLARGDNMQSFEPRGITLEVEESLKENLNRDDNLLWAVTAVRLVARCDEG